MELRQLNSFVAVAEEGGFAAAATRLALAQSTVSWAVKRLEGEIGAELFDRSRHGTTLTETGRALLPEARRVLAALDGAWDAVEEAKHASPTTLRVVAVPVFEIFDLPTTLERFALGHPEARLQIRQTNEPTPEILRRVASRAVDLAICSVAQPPPKGIEFVSLAEGPLGMAVPNDDPLLVHVIGGLELSAVAGRTFVDIPRGFSTRDAADRVFSAAGIERRTGYEVDNIRTALDYVRAGRAIAMTAEAAIPPGDTLLRFVPLEGDAPRLTMGIASTVDPWRSALVAELRDELVRTAVVGTRAGG